MNNWKEYINAKFQPESEFEFDDKTTNGDFGYLTVKHKGTESEFTFFYPSKNWNKIQDVQFHNKQTEGWSGEFWESEFSETEKQKLDEFLKPAFETGWSSKDYHFLGKHYKSKVYWNKNFKGKPFRYYSSLGCVFAIMFPITFVLSKLMEWKIINGMKKIIVEPIK